MNLIDKIMLQLNQKNQKHNEQDKLKKGVVAVQNAYDESDTKKEANQNAMNTVIETIQAHPEMPVGEFLKMIQQHTDLSDNSLVEIIKQMPDVKSEEATVAAVEKVELPSKKIAEIIQDAPVSPKTAQKIAEQIPDEEIQKEQQAEIEKRIREEQEQKILSELTKIYNNCDEINDNELATMIEKLEIGTRTEKIEEKLEHIIAKRVALDCMKYGGPKIPTMIRIMPATDMLEANLPFLTEKEYQKIKSDYDEQGKEYHIYGTKEKKLVKEKLLENIAKKVAENFDEIGDISVPQIEQLQKLNEEELNLFTNTVKNYCSSEKLDKNDIDRIKRQLRGDTVDEWDNLKRMLEKMKPKDREIAVRNFLQMLKSNEDKTPKQKEFDKTMADICECIKKIPSKKRLNTAKAILKVLEEHQEKVDIIEENKEIEEIESKVDEIKSGEDR